MSTSSAYFVETRWSGSEDEPSHARMDAILAELDTADPEHPDIWLTHSSGWTIAADEDRYLVLSNPEQEVVGHIANASRRQMLEFWGRLSRGEIESLLKEPWLYGRPPADPVKLAAIAAKVAESQRQQDREFYSILGEENPNERCRTEGCSRGRISVSWLCKIHHFESIKGRKCPYSD